MDEGKAEAVVYIVLAVVSLPFVAIALEYLVAGGWFVPGLPSVYAGVAIVVWFAPVGCLYAAYCRWNGLEIPFT